MSEKLTGLCVGCKMLTTIEPAKDMPEMAVTDDLGALLLCEGCESRLVDVLPERLDILAFQRAVEAEGDLAERDVDDEGAFVALYRSFFESNAKVRGANAPRKQRALRIVKEDEKVQE